MRSGKADDHHHISELMRPKKYNLIIWVLTLAINGLIATAYFLPKSDILKGYDLSGLPLLNALLNGLTFLCLLMALFAIKRKNVKTHRILVLMAFLSTSIFLFSYLLYHFTTPSTRFGGTGTIRLVYFLILVTHIFLAAVIVPLALITMAQALNGRFERHRRIARWTMPIWLYVSLTGVIVYLLISPYYPG